MNKELQDLAWSILPKEFKEEVKSKYKNAVRLNEYAHECVVLRDLFGEDNLTSDADGEEMLMVRRKKVQAFFMNFKCEKSDAKSTFDKVSLGARMSMLHELFGSKCLPDDSSKLQASCRQVNVDSLPQNPTENCDNKSHISDDCNKPAEPKFKVGDIAVVRGFKHPLLKSDGAIVTILSYHDKGDFYSCAIAPNVGIDIDAKYLEPYTEPTANNPKKSANTFASDEPTDTKSDDFDRIVNDGFRSHNRLHIAATILSGIYGNDFVVKHNYMKDLVKIALEATDALIAECELTDKLKEE